MPATQDGPSPEPFLIDSVWSPWMKDESKRRYFWNLTPPHIIDPPKVAGDGDIWFDGDETKIRIDGEWEVVPQGTGGIPGPDLVLEQRSRMKSKRVQGLVDFLERVLSTAFLAGYATYIALPHSDTKTDFKVAGIAALGSAGKFVAKWVAAWQAANMKGDA